MFPREQDTVFEVCEHTSLTLGPPTSGSSSRVLGSPSSVEDEMEYSTEMILKEYDLNLQDVSWTCPTTLTSHLSSMGCHQEP